MKIPHGWTPSFGPHDAIEWLGMSDDSFYSSKGADIRIGQHWINNLRLDEVQYLMDHDCDPFYNDDWSYVQYALEVLLNRP